MGCLIVAPTTCSSDVPGVSVNNTSSPSSILLPAHRVRVFDPVEVYRSRIGSRMVVYLDTNIWIELRDAPTTEAARCRDTCHRAVTTGRAIFPVSYASVSEVLENPVDGLRTKQADLMDALSLGVTFRNPTHVYALEGEAAYRFVFHGEPAQLRREEAFTSLPDHIGDGHLDFPDGWRAADVEKFVSLYKTSGACSVRWLVDHGEPVKVRAGHSSVETYAERMDAQRTAQRAHLAKGKADGRVDREGLVHDERVALFKAHVLPAMRNAGLSELGLQRTIELVRSFREREGDGSRRRLREVFRAAAPALEVLAHVFGRRALDPQRKTKRQDFWDTEHAGLAPVYADAFVTADGGLNEVLRLGERRPPAARATLLQSVAALDAWLCQAESGG